MTTDKNVAHIIGTVERDAETRHTRNGNQVTNVGVVTVVQNDGRTNTTHHRVVVWGDGETGTTAASLRRDMRVEVVGRTAYRKWEKQDGTSQWITEIVADTVAIVDGGNLETTVQDGRAADDESAPF